MKLLSNERKSRFTCCLIMGFNLITLKMTPELFAWCYSGNHYSLFIVRDWCHHDFADAILYWEIKCKKLYILMYKLHFQCHFSCNQVKYARITIRQVCFTALTLGESLRWCLNTWPIGLMLKQLPRDPAMLMYEKHMWSLYFVRSNLINLKS